MYTHAATPDLVQRLSEERIARSLEAYHARRARAQRDCPLERLARWVALRSRKTLDPALLSR